MKTIRISRFAGFILITILAIGLSACQRSKSQAPVTTAAPTGGFASPTENLGVFETLTPEPNLPLPTEPGGATSQDTPAPAVTATSAIVIPTATATTAPVLPTPAKPPENYTLQRGEFLYCIARRFDINPSNLLSYNSLTAADAENLAEGYVLKIPQSAPAFPGNRALKVHPAQYTVAAGDTIYKIACAYGDVSPEIIAAANNLSAPYTLTAGTVLQIP